MVGQLLDLVIFHPLQLLVAHECWLQPSRDSRACFSSAGKCLRRVLAFASFQERGLFLQGASQQHFTYPPG